MRTTVHGEWSTDHRAELIETSKRSHALSNDVLQAGGGAERMAAFQRTVNLCHRQVQELKTVVTSLFQAVSAHRFRDVAPDIRAVVIEGIGSWIALHPTEFLQDTYLKYVAWALSDRVSDSTLPTCSFQHACFQNLKCMTGDAPPNIHAMRTPNDGNPAMVTAFVSSWH